MWSKTGVLIIMKYNNSYYTLSVFTQQTLMVNHDRFGLFRPTANDKGETVNAEWSTVRNVHLDVSSFIYREFCWHCTYVVIAILIILLLLIGSWYIHWLTPLLCALQMNPWVYTLPRGEGAEEFDTNSLKYEYLDDFIEENNHPGRMEDGQVQ